MSAVYDYFGAGFFVWEEFHDFGAAFGDEGLAAEFLGFSKEYLLSTIDNI